MTELPISKVFFFLSSFLLISSVVFGQGTASDTAFLTKANTYARNIYSQSIGDQAGLYNGVEYRGFPIRNTDEGHPFFLSDDWIEGSVIYDGEEYSGVAIQYDIINDKVVIEQPYSHFKLELISEKIKSFSLPGHAFVRLLQNTNDSSLSTGFYEVLYNGSVKVLAKRRKHTNQILDPGKITIQYIENDKLFIYKKGRFYTVKSKLSALSVFNDLKKEIRKFIRKNNINFRKERDHSMVLVARFYDESGKQP